MAFRTDSILRIEYRTHVYTITIIAEGRAISANVKELLG